MQKEPSFCPFGRNQVRQPKDFRSPNMAGEASLSAAEACPRKETFVSVWDFRPPKVPPKVPDFRLWRDFRPPNLPPKVPCPAFLCMFLHGCFEMF